MSHPLDSIFRPRSVAVIGVGDLESLCSFSTVPTTSVSPDMDTLGYQAASVLDQIMSGRRAPAGPGATPAPRR